jgi:hypothetical protein
MTLNGGPHLSSFEEVEDEFRAVRAERANGHLELLEAIGKLTGEVSGARGEVSEVRRVMVESGAQFRYATDDTGSHDLRATYHAISALAKDPTNPLRPGDVRNIVADVTEEMRLRAEVGTWRRIKAFPAWAARKALEKGIEWAVLVALGAVAAELWRLLHR